ncbi:MAG: hypothetical protein ACT4O5_03545 [Gammaproteobacteria bacterium]
MRNPLLRRTIGCTALALLSFPAWAVYNGVEFAGVKPDEVTSGEISFGDQPAVRLVSRDECEKLADEDEECDSTYLWFARSASNVAVGTQVNVTLRDRNGNTRTGTGTVTANGVRVNVAGLPSSSTRTSDAGTSPGVGVRGGHGEWTLPSGAGGLGIRFTTGSPGSERFITLAPEDYEGESGGFSVRVPTWLEIRDRRTAFVFDIDYGQFDAEDSTTFAAGTDGRGVAHQVENAPSGSTGLAFPTSTPLDTRVANDIETWSAELGGVTLPGDNGISWGIGLRYRLSKQDLFNSMTTATFPGIFATLDEEIEDQYLAIPLTFGKTWNNTGTVRPNMHLQIAPGFYKSELKGTYEFACNVCAPADQSFEQRIDDDDDGFSWEGAAGIGLDLRLGDRFVVGLYGQYKYFDHTSFADNRESPLDEPVQLGEDTADGWAAGINFGLEFRQ